ncbi:SRPBCC domain-containing protein [Streptomyces sp. PT12]|uniref:SRPBCC domain-containing protein n=1 Tax=Streptomyces sp. PT12 TaxID=1510197 RepID=UPI000DE1DE40|nr:SRPBCC domain-containing protein [Streptomyces sp. PT12]RBM20712.1 ATPase [Streptomyces sp. PT12]
MSDPLPQQPVAATLERAGEGRWALALERELSSTAEEVWAALTEAEWVARWAPYTPGRDLDSPGPVALPETDPADPAPQGAVLAVTPPRLLALAWYEDELRFALTPADTGTRLRLTHVWGEGTRAAELATGWHLCLAALTGALEGRAVPRVVGEAAREHGFDRLRDQYADLLGAP